MEDRINKLGYYCGKWEQEVPVTSFSVHPGQAIIYAQSRAREYHGTPLLIAVPVNKYIDAIRPGVEIDEGIGDLEIEVTGPITPEDIIVVDSPERLNSLYTGHRKWETEKLSRLFFEK